ncbi:hypothetical protein TRFO_32161 [Tritrichomonas foetus]|uniref:Uncharacterized protein n=1 Tax=Tritrichomonas foetus TaxID=1144522 RepID=A0A1J4JTX5_9EUKA|nr:hypothetical protein TRFO_32161 [Tritrichomonas foetus]|eukprot:OHT00956.1 hypothetical protein TRFO_32161 [Tritrichomonas foetus]
MINIFLFSKIKLTSLIIYKNICHMDLQRNNEVILSKDITLNRPDFKKYSGSVPELLFLYQFVFQQADLDDDNVFAFPAKIKKILKYSFPKNDHSPFESDFPQLERGKDIISDFPKFGEFDKNDTSKHYVIPFPPSKVNPKFELFISLASIFSTFIGIIPADFAKSQLLTWLYNFRTKYPNMPNIYSLILLLGVDLSKLVKENINGALHSLIIHKFVQKFNDEQKLNVHNFSLSIPKDDFFVELNYDIILFTPLFTPITEYSLESSKDPFTLFYKKINKHKEKTDNKTKNEPNDIIQQSFSFYAGIFIEDGTIVTILKKDQDYYYISLKSSVELRKLGTFDIPRNCISVVFIRDGCFTTHDWFLYQMKWT